MRVTPLPITTSVSPGIPAKACVPIEVTLFGIAIAVKLIASKKAWSPIVSRELGKRMYEACVSPNAPAPISLIPSGINTSPSHCWLPVTT